MLGHQRARRDRERRWNDAGVIDAVLTGQTEDTHMCSYFINGNTTPSASFSSVQGKLVEMSIMSQ